MEFKVATKTRYIQRNLDLKSLAYGFKSSRKRNSFRIRNCLSIRNYFRADDIHF